MKNPAEQVEYSLVQKALAFSVHCFTASGVLTAILAIIAISDAALPQSDAGHCFKTAMLWLFAAQVIDGVDGAFARLFKAKEVLPNWDGKAIDYVIDFATYAIIPAFFIYQADLLPESLNFIGISIILLVSALYYGKDGMVSTELHFVGFPVMWNMVAFYMYFVTDLEPMTNFIVVIILAIMHFVPIKFPYPSRTKKFMLPNLIVTTTFVISCVYLLFTYPKPQVLLQWLAIACLVYYSAVSTFYTYNYGKEKN